MSLRDAERRWNSRPVRPVQQQHRSTEGPGAHREHAGQPRAPTLPPPAALGRSALDLGENDEVQGGAVQQNDSARNVRDLDA